MRECGGVWFQWICFGVSSFSLQSLGVLVVFKVLELGFQQPSKVGIYIYIYIYMCVSLIVFFWGGEALVWNHL